MNCKQEPDAKEGKVPALNPEKAYEILMNVFQACKIEPPPNCHVYFENAFLLHHLHEISAEDFSLREWEDAVSYLTGQNQSFTELKQAKKYLLGCTLNQCEENHEKR